MNELSKCHGTDMNEDTRRCVKCGKKTTASKETAKINPTNQKSHEGWKPNDSPKGWEKWGHCKDCRSSDKKYYSSGYCKSCYYIAYRRGAMIKL